MYVRRQRHPVWIAVVERSIQRDRPRDGQREYSICRIAGRGPRIRGPAQATGDVGKNPWVTVDEIDVVLDAVFKSAKLVSPWFRLRPFLRDTKDDLYIECALAAGAKAIVTNDRHFDIPAVGDFGLSVVRPGALLAEFRKRNQ
jgi:hypothetical protein